MTVKVVAECGVNFSSIRDAIDMIRAAKKASAYAVKFQLFNDETIKDSPHFEQLHKLILTEENVKELQEEAKSEKLAFVLTPMYPEAMEIATKYADCIKIRFKDNENQPLIDKALDTGKTLLISVPRPPINMSFTLNPRVFPLYCISRYPPEPEDFNLDSAAACKGFSSHFPHTLFDLAFAINRLFDDVFIEKHVMFKEHLIETHSASDDKMIDINYHPIDEAVSITFEELTNFIKQLQLIERIQRTRL